MRREAGGASVSFNLLHCGDKPVSSLQFKALVQSPYEYEYELVPNLWHHPNLMREGISKQPFRDNPLLSLLWPA